MMLKTNNILQNSFLIYVLYFLFQIQYNLQFELIIVEIEIYFNQFYDFNLNLFKYLIFLINIIAN